MADQPSFGPPITSRTNARVKQLRASLSGAARKPGDLLGLEGVHLIGEAHRSGLSFETVFLRAGSERLLAGNGDWSGTLRASHWVALSHEVFDSAVSTEAPQGIAATWIITDFASDRTAPVSLVLEGVQDPGNLGTLLRSSEAFHPGSAVMVTPSTVNQWNPKVVRASAGSVFRVPVIRAGLEDLVSRLRANHVRLFAAVAGGQTTYPDLSGRCAVLIGNEGAGLSPRAMDLADAHVTIPCHVESLNAAVAGSILLYETMHQQSVAAATPKAANL